MSQETKDSPFRETVTEYRVVRDDDGLAGLPITSLADAEAHKSNLESEHWRGHSIQSRTVTTTPWEDVTEANQETKGERNG